MKAIMTKYRGPTNYRPAKIVASDGDGNRTILSIGGVIDTYGQHAQAANKLCHEMGWKGRLVEGTYGNDHVFVFAE